MRIHLHTPTSGPVCGAVVGNRAAQTTAYRSEVTCRDCIATLRCEACHVNHADPELPGYDDGMVRHDFCADCVGSGAAIDMLERAAG